MPLRSMSELLLLQVQDLYSGEMQIAEALPTFANASSNETLAKWLRQHLDETNEQLARLAQIFELLGVSADGTECAGMGGLVREGLRTLAQDAAPAILDAAIIADAQRVEHYEIAAYRSAITHAKLLSRPDVATLLIASLEEEQAADQALIDVAEFEVNLAAMLIEAQESNVAGGAGAPVG